MKATIQLGKIAGIDVGVHYSWIAILVLVVCSLAEGFLPEQHAGWAAQTYWATAVFAALLMFASLLVHELAHSLVARARGFSVIGITLFVLGAVSNLKTEPSSAKDEFVVSAVGPLASLGLAAAFWTVGLAMGDGDAPAQAVIWYLALVNLVLAGSTYCRLTRWTAGGCCAPLSGL